MAPRFSKGSKEYYDSVKIIRRTSFSELKLAACKNEKELIDRYHPWIRAVKSIDAVESGKLFQMVGERLGLESINSFYTTMEHTKDCKKIEIIMDAIEQLGLRFSEENSDPLFLAMKEFLGIPPSTMAKAAEALTGTFQVWRHSSTFPGRYTKGFIEFGQNDLSGALTARMVQRYKPSDKDEKNQHLLPLIPNNAEFDESGSLQRFGHVDDGYFFRLTGEKGYFLLLSDTSAPATSARRGMMRLSLLHRRMSVGRQVTELEGDVFGIDEGRTLFSYVFMKRVSDDYPGIEKHFMQLQKEGKWEKLGPNIYKEDEVPEPVLELLRRPPIIRPPRA
jgi:hypothetical protein